MDSRSFEDYHIAGMNIGWEVPGLFDVGMQIRDLGLRVTGLPGAGASESAGENPVAPGSQP